MRQNSFLFPIVIGQSVNVNATIFAADRKEISVGGKGKLPNLKEGR